MDDQFPATSLIAQTLDALNIRVQEVYGVFPPDPLPHPPGLPALEAALESNRSDLVALKSSLRAYWDAWVAVLV